MPFNFTEFFTAPVVAANWTEAGSNMMEYMGGALFGSKKKAGLDLKWIRGSRGIPVSLMPSAFDAKATFRDRIGVTVTETEMPFFREGYKIKEKDRQEILRATESNDPYAQAVISKIFDDTNDLIAGARVVPERMIFQLLFPVNGSVGINIKANGVDYTYNYDADGAWKKTNYTAMTTNDLWSATATANPFKTFQTAKDTMAANHGTQLVTAIMNSTTFNMMAATDAVKNRWMTASGRAIGFITPGEVKAVMQETVGLNIAVYDKQYKDEDGKAHKFVPDGYVCLIPSGELGSIWYGTTPEEADLMGNPQASVSIVDTGVAISTIVQPHPVNVNIIASEIVLPSYERMDEVAVIKVAN